MPRETEKTLLLPSSNVARPDYQATCSFEVFILDLCVYCFAINQAILALFS